MLPSTELLPPVSFLPTSAAYSANCSAGLFHPTASHGVRAVSSVASLPLCLHIGWSASPFPGPHLTPFEAFPSLVAVLRHRSLCLLAVVPIRCFQRCVTRPQGFAPPPSPLPIADVAICDQPDTPLGLVPFQGTPLVPIARVDSSGVSPPWRLTLGRVHRSGCALDVVAAEATSELLKATPSQRRASEDTVCDVLDANIQPAGLPTEVSLPLNCPSRPLVHFSRSTCRSRRDRAMD